MPIAIGAALHLRCTDALSTDPQNTRAQAAVRATTQAVCAESRVSRSALALITNGSLNGGAQALADLVCRLSDEADRATPAASAAHAHVRSGRAPDHAHNRDPSHADQRDPARGRAGRAFGARAWSARDLTGRSAAAMAPAAVSARRQLGHGPNDALLGHVADVAFCIDVEESQRCGRRGGVELGRAPRSLRPSTDPRCEVRRMGADGPEGTLRRSVPRAWNS